MMGGCKNSRTTREALAAVHGEVNPNFVIGTPSHGGLIGVLTAKALEIGFAEVRNASSLGSDCDSGWETSTAPDCRNWHLDVRLRRSRLKSGDRALFVDHWIASGAQARAVKQRVEMSGATWVGASVVVEGLHG